MECQSNAKNNEQVLVQYFLLGVLTALIMIMIHASLPLMRAQVAQ
jgi:hypothetical protein